PSPVPVHAPGRQRPPAPRPAQIVCVSASLCLLHFCAAEVTEIGQKWKDISSASPIRKAYIVDAAPDSARKLARTAWITGLRSAEVRKAKTSSPDLCSQAVGMTRMPSALALARAAVSGTSVSMPQAAATERFE